MLCFASAPRISPSRAGSNLILAPVGFARPADCRPDGMRPNSDDGRVPLLVIDGQEVPWDELGRMLISFDGWQFGLAVCDRSEEV